MIPYADWSGQRAGHDLGSLIDKGVDRYMDTAQGDKEKKEKVHYMSMESPPLAKLKPPGCCWPVPRVKPVCVC